MSHGYKTLSEGEKEGEWGYEGIERNTEDFLKRLESLMISIKENSLFQGFCYTQFADVYQEINGLVDDNHKPKLDVEAIRRVITI